MAKSRLQEIKEQYDAAIPEKIAVLKKLVQNKELPFLREEIHKMSGSAGSFGYEKVSALCKELEIEINKHLNQEIDEKWLKDLEGWIEKIEKGFLIKVDIPEIFKRKLQK